MLLAWLTWLPDIGRFPVTWQYCPINTPPYHRANHLNVNILPQWLRPGVSCPDQAFTLFHISIDCWVLPDTHFPTSRLRALGPDFISVRTDDRTVTALAVALAWSLAPPPACRRWLLPVIRRGRMRPFSTWTSATTPYFSNPPVSYRRSRDGVAFQSCSFLPIGWIAPVSCGPDWSPPRWRSRIHVRVPHTDTCSAGRSEQCDEIKPRREDPANKGRTRAGSKALALRESAGVPTATARKAGQGQFQTTMNWRPTPARREHRHQSGRDRRRVRRNCDRPAGRARAERPAHTPSQRRRWASLELTGPASFLPLRYTDPLRACRTLVSKIQFTRICSHGDRSGLSPRPKWAVRRHSRHSWPALYQLDFVTPGISPCKANRRKSMRDMPNRLRNPRVRPERRHRFLTRLGLALRGSACSPRCASIRSSNEDPGFRIISFKWARCSAYCFTTFFRFSFLMMQLFLAIGPSSPLSVVSFPILPTPNALLDGGIHGAATYQRTRTLSTVIANNLQCNFGHVYV